MNSPYAYVLATEGDPEVAVFTWPNCAKKYIRDTYTTDGELHLPPEGHLSLFRYKVNPKAGSRILGAPLNVEKFLEA